MREVFKKVSFYQVVKESFRPVPLIAGPKNMIMRALNVADGIQLNKPKLFNNLQRI